MQPQAIPIEPSSPISHPSTKTMSSPLTTYAGSCHCNHISFTVRSPALTTSEVVSDNCSICTKNGYLLIYRPHADIVFTNAGGLGDCAQYQFNKKKATHHFCPQCGTSLFIEPNDEDLLPGMKAINVGTCLGWPSLFQREQRVVADKCTDPCSGGS